ncbi:MAG TPA: alpha-2-macroglobulin family protein, partial [Candidatus Eremiobacteraceae bacterium]|nr:alpha-2-macroglobulin family protein [Candidatus Eremiobacteraceae bacterium]
MEPGGQQTLRLHLRDAAGRSARGEFVVAVVDDSVLRLTGYRPPDLVGRIWDYGIPTSLIAGDNYGNVLLSPLHSELLASSGYGRPRAAPEPQIPPGVAGNFYDVNTATQLRSVKTLGRVSLLGSASTVKDHGIVVRTNFNVLAYYSAAVRTDADGNARVSFKVPDSLTTWRVMAEAVGAPHPGIGMPDLRFGYAETTFVTHKPVAITPLFPQFARPNDRPNIGVNLTNDTGVAGTASIRGFLQGPLAFANGERLARELSTNVYASQGTVGHRFGVRATGWGTGLIEFQAALGANNDAFQLPLPLLPLEVTEHVVETGTTTTSVAIPVNVDPYVDPLVGGLNVTLASSLLPEITVPAGQVLDGLDIPLLEPSASRLFIAADLRVLGMKFKHPVSRFDPMKVAGEQLDHLVELQNGDGGFSYWPGSPVSDPWDSAYAAEALGHAVTAGISVDPVMITNLRAYLDRVVDDPQSSLPYWVDEICLQRLRLDAMLGLRAIGEQRTQRLADVYRWREYYGLAGRAKLALMLTKTPGWSSQAKAATDKLQEIVYETGRYATVDVPEGWWWYDSVTCAQSLMLRLFVAQRINPEILDNVLRGLVARQRNGAWLNQYDTAQALRAIVDYAQLEPLPPNFTATAVLDGRQIDSTHFAGYEKTAAQINVPMAQLPRNRSNLVLEKSGTGRLHYVVEYGYRVQGAQNGSVNGFRLERTVTEANQKAVLVHVQLKPLSQPALLNVAKVYDVELHVVVD